MSKDRLKVHLSWALFTVVSSAAWGRWTALREEPELRVPQRTSRRAARAPSAEPRTPLSAEASPLAPGLPAESPAALAKAQTTSPSEEERVRTEVHRLLHSPRRKDAWEALTLIERITLPRLKAELLHEQLADKDESLRGQALSQIAMLEGVAALATLEKALLTDPSEDIRQAAAIQLGALGSPQAVQALLDAFHDPVLAVRVAAAGALQCLGQPGPASELIPLFSKDLESPDGAVRRNAAESLGSLNSPLSIAPLLRALRDSNGNVRTAAADSLSSMSVPEIVPSLEALLKDPDPQVAGKARQTLEDYRAQHPQ